MKPIVVENVTRSFGDNLILSDISFRVEPSEFVVIVGPSGCGKTTLLRIFHGLDQADSGHVHIGEKVVAGKPSHVSAYVFQSDSLLPWRTAHKNVMLGLQLRKMDKDVAEPRAREALERVGLAGSESLYPRQMSGGMRQRVNIARALVVDPDVIFMDEPYASLDAQTREVMQADLLKIWGRDRKTVVFITHQLDEAVYLADRVLVMGRSPGRILADLKIDFERPRDLSLKRSAEFGAYVEQIWSMIADSVIESS